MFARSFLFLVAFLALSSTNFSLSGQNAPAPSPGADDAESVAARLAGVFHYRWDLAGLGGAVAGLFFPDEGDGVLSFELSEDGEMRNELSITAEKTEDGEHFTYGSRIDAATGHSVEAWSSYRWRGRTKSKRQDVEEPAVVDIVSGIYAIRLDPSAERRRLEVWSDGKLYPVEVVPRGRGFRTVAHQKIEASRFVIRGLQVPDRRRWKGKVEVWLSVDGKATPVEIRISRSFATVRLRLQSLP